MDKFNPCYEHCYLRFGKQYSKECDNNCAYAADHTEMEKLKRFKAYFDELYGKGLDVMNYHLNGNSEPFDSFYESALEEMDKENTNDS